MSCSESVSRRESVVSDTDQSETEGTVEAAFVDGGFVSPLDTILKTVKTIYSSKTQIRKAQYEKIEENINKMKSHIIDFLLPLAKQPKKSSVNEHISPNENPERSVQPSYAQITAPKPKNANVILKTGLKSEADIKKVVDYEKSVAECLTKNNIKATIHATLPTKNGDIVMKFDKNDDITAISKHIGEELEIKTIGRGLLLPKIKITHIPEYMTSDPEELTEMIINSNEWLRREKQLPNNGNHFVVLFTYKVKDFITAVCKISPEVRHRLLGWENNQIRVGMRICPITDRIHVTRCGKCQKYGHKTTVCKADSYVCSWCSGDHKTSACTKRDDTSSHKCANCSSNERSFNHPCHSNSCQILLKEKERVKNRTDWGEAPPPSE